ncbi:type IV pilin protein [Variovorax sp. OV329]|uniref:type IV pilin protein n=1 Tax=Variovorax sp. OV329 TaxID=1882825 RepID=UPI0008E86096|nr:type IV pilin protein [Variovorax sp. OV329]SFM31887.1 type IV pilus assembly protein PilE [Variovorax sp. OV329]
MAVVSRCFGRAAAASRGFTLVEVMIVVAIVALLSTIAYPSYTDYLRRGHAQEAPGTLLAYRAKMEQYYHDNRSYANGAACAVPVPTTPETEYFSYSCSISGGGQAYTATATGAQRLVTGLAYSIDQLGNRSSTCTGCAWNFSGVQGTWVLRKP